MKSTIVLAVLLAGTPAFAQYGYGPAPYGYGQGSPGATMQDYRLAPHQRTTRQRTTRQRRGLYGYTQQRVAPQQAAPRAPEAAGGGAVKQPMGRP